MFIFGHLGYGAGIGQLARFRRPLAALLLGALLPDLIDKPLYYSGLLGLPGTRTYGHTILFLLILLAGAVVLRSRFWLVMAFGDLTHLFIDNVGDALTLPNSGERNWQILAWPLRGWEFPPTPHLSFHDQLNRLALPYFLFTEVSGLLILIGLFLLSRRHKSERDRREHESSNLQIK